MYDNTKEELMRTIARLHELSRRTAPIDEPEVLREVMKAVYMNFPQSAFKKNEIQINKDIYNEGIKELNEASFYQMRKELLKYV